jgi:nucleotide-binding universal stress UspA family protein
MNWGFNKTIVVPIDFSQESFQALDEALEIAASPLHVHVVFVMSDCRPGVPEIQLTPCEREIESLQVRATLREQLNDGKYAAVHVAVCCGDPGMEIVKFAEHVKANLIVMPSSGRGGLPVGSVAERVIRLAHCPVLVMKAEVSRGIETRETLSVSTYAGEMI